MSFSEEFSGNNFTEAPADAENAFFHRCTFHKLAGTTLKDCKLYGSRFAMIRPEDIIGVTLTMDCDTFSNVELSPEVFDYLMLLICKTSGNTKKRLAIIENVVGHDKSLQLLKELEQVE